MIRMKNNLALVILIGTLAFAACKKESSSSGGQQARLPLVTSLQVVSVSSTSAVCVANVNSDGGSALTNVGICWGTQSNPTLIDNSQKNGTSLGAFIQTISGLNPGTTYHVRAYATNKSGTSYSDEQTFTTPDNQLGKYNHTNGMGAYFEFFNGDSVHYGGPASYVSGTYSMLTTTHVKVNIGTWGEGDFSNDFKTLMIASNTFTR